MENEAKLEAAYELINHLTQSIGTIGEYVDFVDATMDKYPIGANLTASQQLEMRTAREQIALTALGEIDKCRRESLGKLQAFALALEFE